MKAKINHKKRFLTLMLIVELVFLAVPSGQIFGVSAAGRNPERVIFIGDSLTWGYIRQYERAKQTIPGIVKKQLGVSVTNAGKNGICVARKGSWKKSIAARLEKGTPALRGYDVIVIAAGTNDHARGVPLGTKNSTEITTFYGAWNRIFTLIRKANPSAKVVIVTPVYKTTSRNMLDGAGYGLQNKKGISLQSYVRAERVIAKKYGAWLYDSSKKLVINGDNARQYLVDGIHPNQEGYRKLGLAFAAWLRKKMFP